MNALLPSPGVLPNGQSQWPGVLFHWCINKSGGALAAGDVVVHDPTAANNVPGQFLPATVTSSSVADVIGVVAYGYSTIPDGAGFLVQIGGLHPAAKVDGTTDVANGDPLTTGVANGAAVKQGTAASRLVFARYVDADYTANEVALKKVWLLNPMGLAPHR